MDAMTYGFWKDATIMLASVAFVSASFRKIGANPILGLFAAGAALGPHGFEIVGESASIEFMSELGVMFLLFMMGLELSFDRLRTMARWIFGLGFTHYLACATAIGGVAWLFGLGSQAAIALGIALSLSSTAFVLQVLSARGEISTRPGRKAFCVLLFQDLMVAPVLALIPLIAGRADSGHGPGMLPAAVCMIVLFMVARMVLQALLSAVRDAEGDEEDEEAGTFPAAILCTALGMGLAAHLLGLSPTLGAFLAGLALSDAEWRHEVKVAIAPFKHMLLAFFFLAAGFKIPLSAAPAELAWVVVFALTVIAVKGAMGTIACLANGMPWRDAVRASCALAQGGEFSIVVIGTAAAQGLLPAAQATLWISGAVLSMALTPMIIGLAARVTGPAAPQGASASANAAASPACACAAGSGASPCAATHET